MHQFFSIFVLKYVMRTTLNIPKELIDEAMDIAGSTTKSELIKKALEDLIEKHKRMKLLNFRGSVNLSIDTDKLRNRK